MPATKIINIQKSDSFEDVFDAFKRTEAQDVIFIFPKGSKFASKGEYLESIKQEADHLGKKVSIMSSDPIIGRLALNYGFDILSKGQTNTRSSSPVAAKIKNDPRKVKVESADDEWEPISGKEEEEIESSTADVDKKDLDEKEEEFQEDDIVPSASQIEDNIEATLASIRRPTKGVEYATTGKVIRDIVREDKPDRNVDIEKDEDDEDEFDIGINTDTKISRKKNTQIEDVWNRGGSFAETITRKKIKLPKRWYFYIIALVLIVGGAMAYFNLNRATVSVYPVKQNLDFELKVVVSSNTSTVDVLNGTIPGQLFSASGEDSGIFSASGQKDVIQKATGKVTVYSKNLASQRLVATTRFETPEGLVFRIPQTITVPAATKNGAELVMGSIETEVYADRPGIDYNIGPARFTLPGLKSTPKYEDFFALSTKAMSGGIVGPSKIITEDDFTKAQESLQKSVQVKILESLKNQSGDLKILGNIIINFEQPVTNAKAGEGAASLQMTIKGNVQTLGFREENIMDLINNYLAKNNNLEYLPDSLTINYLTPVFDLNAKTLTFTAKVGMTTISAIDQEKIKKDVLGMSEEAVRLYFKDIKEIKTTKISMSPFWVKKVPSQLAKITLKIITE